MTTGLHIILPVIHHLEEEFHEQFNPGTNWHQEGLTVLQQLLKNYPNLTEDFVTLKILFRTSFIKHISSLG